MAGCGRSGPNLEVSWNKISFMPMTIVITSKEAQPIAVGPVYINNELVPGSNERVTLSMGETINVKLQNFNKTPVAFKVVTSRGTASGEFEAASVQAF